MYKFYTDMITSTLAPFTTFLYNAPRKPYNAFTWLCGVSIPSIPYKLNVGLSARSSKAKRKRGLLPSPLVVFF